MFSVYVDADSFPGVLLDIVIRRIVKEDEKIEKAVFVSDRVVPAVRDAVEQNTHRKREEARKRGVTDPLLLRKIRSRMSYVVVPSGPDSADNAIFDMAAAPALCLTHDIPLASRLAAKGITVIDDRGHIYTSDNVGERLSSRNFFTYMRECGIMSERTQPLKSSDVNAFASSFDSVILALGRI